jgi:hypothetical protein
MTRRVIRKRKFDVVNRMFIWRSPVTPKAFNMDNPLQAEGAARGNRMVKSSNAEGV